MSAILPCLSLPADHQIPQAGVFSPRSTMAFDCMNVFDKWQHKKTVTHSDLQETLKLLTHLCLERLPGMYGEHLLLTLICISVISQELHQDHREVVCFLCHLAEHFEQDVHKDLFNCLYNDLEWVFALKNEIASHTSFQDTCRSCHQHARQLFGIIHPTNAILEPREAVQSDHPHHIHDSNIAKTSIHDWYSLTYWLHIILPTTFSSSMTSTTFVSKWFSEWFTTASRENAKAIQVSSLLSIFTAFHETPSDQPPAVSNLERQGSGLLSGLIRRLRVQEPEEASTSSKRSTSVIERSRPLPIICQSAANTGPSPQTPQKLALSPSLTRKGSRISSISRSSSNEQVRMVSQQKNWQIPTSLQNWLTRNEAYTLLERTLKTLAPHNIDANVALQLIQMRSTVQGMTWLAQMDGLEVHLLTQFIDAKKFTSEQLLSFFHLLISQQKDDMFDFGTRLGLAVTISEHLAGTTIELDAKDNTVSIKMLFQALSRLIIKAKDHGWLNILEPKFKEITNGLFHTTWQLDHAAVESLTTKFNDTLAAFSELQDGHEISANFHKKCFDTLPQH